MLESKPLLDGHSHCGLDLYSFSDGCLTSILHFWPFALLFGGGGRNSILM